MRTAISSNHFSHDTQMADAISFLEHNLPDLHTQLLDQFPEAADILWEGSWVDTEQMNLDPEWSSWVVDWIEDNAPIMWEDGEPWTCMVNMHGGHNYTVGDPEYFPSIEAAMDAWWERFESNGVVKVDGVLYPGWGEMEADDTAISTEFDRITAGQIAWYHHTDRIPSETY